MQAGHSFSLALQSSGKVFSWGNNEGGRIAQAENEGGGKNSTLEKGDEIGGTEKMGGRNVQLANSPNNCVTPMVVESLWEEAGGMVVVGTCEAHSYSFGKEKKRGGEGKEKGGGEGGEGEKRERGGAWVWGEGEKYNLNPAVQENVLLPTEFSAVPVGL